MAGTGEVGLLGVERQQHLVGDDTVVEGVDERLEERHAADPEKQCGRRVVHGAHIRGTSPGSAGGRTLPEIW